ncbi:hypothetical protein ANCCEY_13123 [Ancylostoma ceylanicum]|uniref:GATOR1 complex protein NPRL3 C-terminal HTH domain-containing protein n=1 Tax=Ancylostoma ceylanicum TaxID=53326 RepID=A0A0D6L7R5_9BILA|nr:hypothetical protein ANCCEY_13123 [Ancylostoma ceylanicum]
MYYRFLASAQSGRVSWPRHQPMPFPGDGRYISLFSQQFGPSFHLAEALAQFDPPSTLGDYLNSKQPLADQQNKAKVIVALLRHQLIMQLHRFCYIVPPFSDAKMPRAGHHCPDSLKTQIAACDNIDETIKPIVSDLCGSMLDTQSFSNVERKLSLFLRMSAYMHGMHHIEDIVYRLNVSNKAGKINIRTSLGHQVFVNAELKDTVIVKLAGDLFAELKLERAEIFITQKLEILRKKAEICLELASKTKATMKFLMAAIGEYDKLAAKKK